MSFEASNIEYKRMYHYVREQIDLWFVEVKVGDYIYGCDGGTIEADWSNKDQKQEEGVWVSVVGDISVGFGWGNGGPQIDWDPDLEEFWKENGTSDINPFDDEGNLDPSFELIEDPIKVAEFMRSRPPLGNIIDWPLDNITYMGSPDDWGMALFVRLAHPEEYDRLGSLI